MPTFATLRHALVTAALLTSSSASPARISIYTNKRSALASPAKGGVPIPKDVEMISRRPLCAPMGEGMKETERAYAVFDCSLGKQDLLHESERVAWRLLMDPIDQCINKEEKAHIAKANAQASCIEHWQEQFKNAAQKKSGQSCAASTYVDLSMASTHSQDNSGAEELDNNGIYGREYDKTNEDFSYHSSDGSDKDDAGYDCSLGNGTEGTSPPATKYSKDGQFPLGGQVEDLPSWLHEMDTNQSYDASHLLAAPITLVFLCITCNNHSNIKDPTSWIPIFLCKSCNTTWEVFEKKW
jgi:hypothetical protein